MNTLIAILVLGLTAVSASPTRQLKIVGGNTAIISQYPSTVALLYSSDATNYLQSCVGTILTTKCIVTAAHCVRDDAISKWRARVGSTWSNGGGTIYVLTSMLIHPNFNLRTMDSDIALVRSTVHFSYSNVVKAASIASASYNLADNQTVWAVGYGASTTGVSEQLRHIQIATINQRTCVSRYGTLGSNITANMVCAGQLSTNIGAQCVGDSGGPLLHNGVLVGVYSWGLSCANSQYPGINTRISSFTPWIQANANKV
ncbi:trypsin CFT-1-like [Anticarsia gemmatalis]|uniref:trypsin CFT-1-like n=1 Tax=Anticarsia gemmatalis TaxID=129554 RepID=UPI003F770F37